MAEMEISENRSPDPRWIAVRVSRINLGITVLFASVSFPLLWFINGIPMSIRYALMVALTLSLISDLWLILLKGRYSVAAFYLFDLDQESSPRTGERPSPAPHAPRLGIRVRFANGARHIRAERDGVVMRAAFVSPWFTSLRYQLVDDVAWRRWWPRMIPLWPDNLDAEAFRKVRVALKWT